MSRRILIDMLGQVRDGCEIIRQAGIRKGDASWVVRCGCGGDRTVLGSELRRVDRVSWQCGPCRRPRKPLPELGLVVKCWTVIGTSRARHDLVTLRCNHCGYEHAYRCDSIPTWHRSCSVPSPTRGRRYATGGGREGLPGDHPQWARWSAELHMDPTLREVWTPTRVRDVEFWRSNNAAQVLPIEIYVDQRRWVFA